MLATRPHLLALAELLGIPLGERVPPLARRILAALSVDAAALRETPCVDVLGPLSDRKEPTA